MSTTDMASTTTFPFVITTYTNPSPSIRSSYPTTNADSTRLPYISADTHCPSATAYPSIEGPWGPEAACVIHNAAEINLNAYWDLYECCPGLEMSAYGYSSPVGEPVNDGLCMLQCNIDDENGVMWQQVGECLQKRDKEVVCVPKFEERWINQTQVNLRSEYAKTSSRGSTEEILQSSATNTGKGEGLTEAPEGTGQSVSATRSIGVAASLDVVHGSSSKVGFFVVLLLTAGSAAGMFL